MEIKWMDNVSDNLFPSTDTGISAIYHENSKIFQHFEFEVGASMYINPWELKIASRGFKKISNTTKVYLKDVSKSNVPLQKVLATRRSRRELNTAISLHEISTILIQSLGITAIVQAQKDTLLQYLRAWPSAGGLYPLDIYIIAAKTKGFDSGVYHLNILDNSLEKINTRTTSAILNDGFFHQEFITNAAITIVFVAAFSRTKSKYGERGYRLVLLDAGHAAQNVLLTCEQLNINALPIAGFCDDNLANDLRLDGVEEAVIHCISLGKT